MPFVRQIARDPKQRAIVKAMVGLTQELALTTVGEGVEDELTAALLREMGCEVVQGFLYSRPLSAAQLAEWLHQRASTASSLSE